jgi:hypothetical protein
MIFDDDYFERLAEASKNWRPDAGWRDVTARAEQPQPYRREPGWNDDDLRRLEHGTVEKLIR